MSTPITIYQAEDANFVGPLVFEGRGAEGTGYVDYQSSTGDFIEWTIDVETAGTYELSWRYANGSSNRPLELSINDEITNSSVDFDPTGGWQNWKFVTQLVELEPGVNTIRLSANGSSGANFDYLQVTDLSSVPRNVTISDANATEGTDNYLEFDVSLSVASSQAITLDLSTVDGSASGGLIEDFTPTSIDYANQEFEVSYDGGITWEPAINGTEVTFAPTQTELKVRLAINDDTLDEGFATETMTLSVANVLSGTIDDASDTGKGLILNNDINGEIGAPISYLPFTEVRADNDVTFDFDGNDGGIFDRDGDNIGFTMVDPNPNPGNPNPSFGVVGYWSDRIDVDAENSVLKLNTTPGIQYVGNNNLDNAIGIGLNVPSQVIKLSTTLVDLPNAAGGYSQAGLWFGKAEEGGSGSSQDNYIKLVIMSPEPGDYVVQALMEKDGQVEDSIIFDIPDDLSSLTLDLFLDPISKRVTAAYTIEDGTSQVLTAFDAVPQEWFSFDQAGINPSIATRSFGGIFATQRNADSSQVYSFDNFSATEISQPDIPDSGNVGNPNLGNGADSDLPFDNWSIPVNNATSMEMGPDGRLYVATLFGTIHIFEIDYNTRTFTEQIIDTIPTDEGGNRLTLGLAIDPDSTADNVILWVGHSDGSVNNGDLNSGKVSRLSGPDFSNKDDVVTGIPRAIANHATNDIDFGPDGRLYIWQGGNTGAGSANTESSEFKDRPEQPLSGALLAVDVNQWKNDPTNFNGDVASPIGEFVDEFYDRKEEELGRPYTEVEIYASGLRNTYDGVFHSNGNIYAPDNGLGVIGTVPPVPRLGDPNDRDITTTFGENPIDNPGPQSDPLNLIVEGGYYGHPNPYRDEVVFKDGSFQGFDNTDADPTNDIPEGHPEYQEPLFNLGNNRSANGIIEYTADNFFGEMQGDLLINNFSVGDNITRIELSDDGLSVVNSSSLYGGFQDPLPIAMGENGSIFVGEFNGGQITVLEPLGKWRDDLPAAPEAVLDAGSTTLDGKMYMIGGKTDSSHIDSMYIYDPGNPFDSTDDVWTTGPDLLGVGVENPAVVSFDDKVYAFGGSTAPFSGSVSNAAVFDPLTSTWTALDDMPTARGGATAQVVGDKIYVIGGMDANGASVNTVEIYDPLTGLWETGTSMQTRRDNLGAAVIDNPLTEEVDELLYVFGGRTRNANGSVEDDTLNTMEIYDPLTDEWTFGTPMPTGRRAMSVGTLNGRIQVIGGEKAADGSSFDVNEEYNPYTDEWRSLPSVPTGRHGAAFGTIDDVIYVAGGGPTGGSAFTDTVEAFTL